MADPVDLACFNATTESGQLYLIYDAIVSGGGIADNVNVSNAFALETTAVKLPLAQGSTTAGQSGTLVQGAVTTTAPTYTTGQTSPLSLTTTGALRVTSSGTGVQQTPSRSVVTTSGSVTAGAASVTILSSSDFAGTVLGAAFLPSLAETYEAAAGNTLAAIAYTITAGSLTISKVV